MQNRYAFHIAGLIVIVLSILLTLITGNVALPIFTVLFGTILLFFASLENKNVITEKIVLIAILSSIAVAGRIIFAAIPSVQPSSFIIIITGIVFGREVGFLTGAITALTSNLALGQGPWTIWQMFAWGIMGYLSGVLAKWIKEYKLFKIFYGLAWGFVFGWTMNLWFAVSAGTEYLNIPAYITACISSFSFDAAHGITNVILLLLFGDSFTRILSRIQRKYGI